MGRLSKSAEHQIFSGTVHADCFNLLPNINKHANAKGPKTQPMKPHITGRRSNRLAIKWQRIPLTTKVPARIKASIRYTHLRAEDLVGRLG